MKYVYIVLISFALGFGFSSSMDYRFEVVTSSEGAKEAKKEAELSKKKLERCYYQLDQIRKITNNETAVSL